MKTISPPKFASREFGGGQCCGSDIYEWYEIENKAEFEELVRIKHYRSFLSSSCQLK